MFDIVKGSLIFHRLFDTAIKSINERIQDTNGKINAMEIVFSLYKNWIKFAEEVASQIQNNRKEIEETLHLKKNLHEMQVNLKNKFEETLSKEKQKLQNHPSAIKIKQYKDKYQDLKLKSSLELQALNQEITRIMAE